MLMFLYEQSLPNLKVKYSNGLTLYIGSFKDRKLVITNNAITIGEYQIILKDIGEPSDVVGKFDFKHNMHWVEYDDIHAINNNFYLDIKTL